jgi:hypothetical protein
VQGCHTARKLRATQSGVARVAGARFDCGFKYDSRYDSGTEISVFAAAMHYPQNRPQARAGATLRAIRHSSERIENKDLKCAEMATAK